MRNVPTPTQPLSYLRRATTWGISVNRTLALLGVSTGLVAGLCNASAAAVDMTVVEKDRLHDVQTKWPHAKEEEAPRYIKQSVDLEQVRYSTKRHAPLPHIRVAYKARNVLKSIRRRDQVFRTDFTDRDRYSLAWIKSVGRGPVEVWYLDRGGLRKVRCPAARVKLYPGRRKERVVQTVPLRCIKVAGPRMYLRSSARVVPHHAGWKVARDQAPETGLVKVH